MDINLEKDIINSQYIKQKCINSDIYAQNLYSALCNNIFTKNNEEWSCSWRHAGNIIANIRNKNEDYLDWYCSGICLGKNGEVMEGFVTDEVKNDINSLGWNIN